MHRLSAIHSNFRNVMCGGLTVAIGLLANSAVRGQGLELPPQVIGSNPDVSANPPKGMDLNTWLGADAFYDEGYTGSRSVVANIESGFLWNGHESLTQVNTFLYAPSRGVPDVAAHSTATAGLIAGRPTANGGVYQKGIAWGATLWSGAYGFGDDVARATPYYRAVQQGVNGRRADVVNGSWGTLLYDPAATEPNPAILIDGLVAANHVTFVCAAGNSGPASNTLTPPGSCYNTMAVAALAAPDYTSLINFSSRGGSDYHNPISGQTVPAIRATVDIAAPGDKILVPDYVSKSPAANAYTIESGTSFASPLVAGGAALLVDVGYDRFGGGVATDGRVIQSVLQNSARTNTGWNNGTHKGADGVWRTSQSLDWGTGAGVLDLARSFHQYTDGTTDLPGTSGGKVHAIGWDFASVHERSFVDYPIDVPIAGEFRGTLNWWVDRSVTFSPWGSDVTISSTSENSFVNLDLQLWRILGDGLSDRQLVGSSESLYNNTELLRLALDQPGDYMLRVLWTGKNFDRFGTANDVDFGLAWWGIAVPEPASLTMILVASAVLARGRRTAHMAALDRRLS